MTPVFLMDSLAEFIKDATKNIVLPAKTRRDDPEAKAERPAEIFKMRLPDKDAMTQRAPYILLQFLKGKDDKEGNEPEEAAVQIRIVVCTYCGDDAGTGAMDVLNIMLRIRSELKKAGIIGRRFVLHNPLEYMVYTEDTAPYFFGEMITNWSIPVIKREVEEAWL